MKLRIQTWVVQAGLAGLIATMTTGCMSQEARIKEVIVYEIEKCKAEAKGDLYTVKSHDGKEHQILAELCHLEPSDVVMASEFSGVLTTGPLEWRGGDDPETRAMVLTGVSWTEFDRAMRYRNQSTMRDDDYKAAETNFAAAQEIYPESAWLRLERLKNLLEWRTAQGAEVEDPASIGAEARGHLDELVAWAKASGKVEAEAQGRLIAVKYLNDYRDRQQRGIANLGSGDRRIEAAIAAAEEEGDKESAKAYKQELEERVERRPQVQKEMEERIFLAEVEICELREGLSATGVENDSLKAQISSALRSVDCDKVQAAQVQAQAEESTE